MTVILSGPADAFVTNADAQGHRGLREETVLEAGAAIPACPEELL